MDTQSKHHLISYVNNLNIEPCVSNSIKRTIINYGEQMPMTLYRGQQSIELTANYWFSTSSSMDVAKKEFAKIDGYVFVIHVDDAMVLNVNSYLTENDIKEHVSEQEYIVQGGGKFYANSEFKKEGFVQLENNIIETWYHVEPIDLKNEQNDEPIICTYEEFYELNLEELEFIDKKEELYIFEELKQMPKEYISGLYEYLLSKK